TLTPRLTAKLAAAPRLFFERREPRRIQGPIQRPPLLAFVDHLLRLQQGEHGRRNAGVEFELDEHCLDLLRTDAEGQAYADLVLQPEILAIHALRRDGRDTAQLRVEPRL